MKKKLLGLLVVAALVAGISSTFGGTQLADPPAGGGFLYEPVSSTTETP